MQLAKSEAASHAPSLRLKKLYLLAALEVDQVKARMLNIGGSSPGASPSRAGPASTETAAAADTLADKLTLTAHASWALARVATRLTNL